MCPSASRSWRTSTCAAGGSGCALQATGACPQPRLPRGPHSLRLPLPSTRLGIRCGCPHLTSSTQCWQRRPSESAPRGGGQPDPQAHWPVRAVGPPPGSLGQCPHPGWDVSACSELTGAGGPRCCGRPPETPAGPHTPQALTASLVKLQINLRIREMAPKIRVCSCTLSDCTKQGRIICRGSKETPPTPSVGSHPPRSVPHP